jgi:hypothetical protein
MKIRPEMYESIAMLFTRIAHKPEKLRSQGESDIRQKRIIRGVKRALMLYQRRNDSTLQCVIESVLKTFDRTQKIDRFALTEFLEFKDDRAFVVDVQKLLWVIEDGDDPLKGKLGEHVIVFCNKMETLFKQKAESLVHVEELVH